MLRAIVFDFDGVLVDSEPLHFQAFARIAPRMGTTLDYTEYLAHYIGFDDRDALRELCRKAGRPMTESDLSRFRELKQAAFDELVAAGVPMIAGARALVEEASSLAVGPAWSGIAIASGATRRDIELVLGPLGLRDRFRTIVSADDVACSKPDPATYRLAVERLGALLPDPPLRPEQCLAIEDTAAGLASARAAGLCTLALTTTSRAEALSNAHRILPDLEGVTLAQLRQWYE